MEVVATIIENCLRVDPDERWTANQILAFAQQSFAVEVQRIWKGRLYPWCLISSCDFVFLFVHLIACVCVHITQYTRMCMYVCMYVCCDGMCGYV